MKPLSNPFASLLCALVAGAGVTVPGATLPADWKFQQPFTLSTNGLVKFSLPVETLDAARTGLDDLRVYDAAGNEVPYAAERPAPQAKVTRNAKSFEVSLKERATIITVETGLAQPIDSVTPTTPAQSYIKAVAVERSTDGRTWQTLSQGQPIFRQLDGASRQRLSFPPCVCAFLRLTVDDSRSLPVAFIGVSVHAAEAEPVPAEPLPVTITERREGPGETRLTLNLGAAHLQLASVHVETPELLFTRQVTLAVPRIVEDTIQEQSLAGGTVYRVAIDGSDVSSNLTVPVERQVDSRELFLVVRNGDSPPLPITAVRAERRPVYLAFFARQAGNYVLLTGNNRCAAPRYDLAALGPALNIAKMLAPDFLPRVENPSYRAPEVLAGVKEGGMPLDTAPWRFRKAINVAHTGAQQLELDLDVLSHASPGWQDLRLLRNGQQVPYILERTSVLRALTPSVTATNDPKHPKLSRWVIKLSHGNLPLTRLTCAARTTLFQRDMALYEDVADERGEKYRRLLGQVSWEQTPTRPRRKFNLPIMTPPRTDTLVLETDNADNPPVDLAEFQLFVPVTRVLFKAKAEDRIYVYYGNRGADAPRYDLSLVAGELLAAEKSAASLDTEEQLKKSHDERVPGKGGLLFWVVLGGVVVVLLIVIARLLPKSSAAAS